MALDATKNFAIVEVSTGYDASATNIVLSSSEGAKLPQPSSDGEFNLVWYNSTDYTNPADDPNVEIVRCTARSTDTLTVTRNQESSGASTKNTGGKTYKMVLSVTAKMFADLQAGMEWTGANTITNETSGTALYIDQTLENAEFNRALTVYCNVAQTNDSLVYIRQNHASSTQPAVEVVNAGTGNGIFVDQNGNGSSFIVDTEATSADVMYITAQNTSGNICVVKNEGNQATGTNTTIWNSNASGAAKVLQVINAGTGQGVFIDQNGEGIAMRIDSDATTENVEYISANSLTTGIGMNLYTNSASFSNTSGFVRILVDNASATGTALVVDQDGTGEALRVNTDAVASSGAFIYSNAVTTGTGRGTALTTIEVENASSTGTAMVIGNDGTGIGLNIDQVGAGIPLNINNTGATEAHIRLNTDATNGTPTEGDFWRASDGLYYYDGTSDINLLAGAVKPVQDFTANDTLTVAESGKVCTNESASGDIQITLPSAAVGLTFTFVVASANYLRVNFASGDKGRYLSTDSATAGYIRSTTSGDTLTMTAISTTIWQVTTLDGTWTVDA